MHIAMAGRLFCRGEHDGPLFAVVEERPNGPYMSVLASPTSFPVLSVEEFRERLRKLRPGESLPGEVESHSGHGTVGSAAAWCYAFCDE